MSWILCWNKAYHVFSGYTVDWYLKYLKEPSGIYLHKSLKRPVLLFGMVFTKNAYTITDIYIYIYIYILTGLDQFIIKRGFVSYAIPCSMIGLENSPHPLNQSEATNRVLVTRIVTLSESILIGSLYIPFDCPSWFVKIFVVTLNLSSIKPK